MSVPTAEFPPLHPFVLAAADLLGLDTPTRQRALGAVLGVATVVLVGLLARRLAGARAGLIAAGAAAVSPVLIEHDAALQAEGLAMVLAAASLLAIHVVMHRAVPWYALVLLGGLLGVAALTRSEALLVLPVAVVLVAWRAGRPTGRRLLVTAALMAGGSLAVVGPWVVRSSVALDGTVLTSTNAGTLVAGGNCDPVYGGEQKGLWLLSCVRAIDTSALETDELGPTRRWLDAGIDYAREHATEVPGVAMVRVLRAWGLWDPAGQIAWETLEGRDRDWHTLAHRTQVVMLALAVAGFVVLRRQPRDLALLLTPVVIAVVVVAASVGNTRFRAGADVALVVAAAVAVDAAVTAVLRRRAAAPARSPG
jgi:4-amino-4-deoxy-L-arabinose transferase-like glycosyltransferase